VGLHEDNVIIHRGYAAENLAVMRKIVLTLLQKDKTANTGILLQRTRAALNTRYL
jgi:predicted transposase YbfD/YdcC